MPQLKTPTSTPTGNGNGNGNGDYARTLNGVNYALDSLKDVYDVRLDGMDKAISVAHEDLVRVPTEVDKAVGSLDKILTERFNTVTEKFVGVQKQFAERDTRDREKAELTQKALDAALSTADKASTKQAESFTSAIDKVESNGIKQMDSIKTQVQSVEANLNDKNANVLAQVARLDNLIVAMTSQRMGRTEQSSDTWGKFVGAAIVGGGIIGLIGFLIQLAK